MDNYIIESNVSDGCDGTFLIVMGFVAKIIKIFLIHLKFIYY